MHFNMVFGCAFDILLYFESCKNFIGLIIELETLKLFVIVIKGKGLTFHNVVAKTEARNCVKTLFILIMS